MDLKILIEALDLVDEYFSKGTIDQEAEEIERLLLDKISQLIPYQEYEKCIVISQQIRYLQEDSTGKEEVLNTTLENYKYNVLVRLNSELISYLQKEPVQEEAMIKAVMERYEKGMFPDVQAGITMFILARKLAYVDPWYSYLYSKKAFKVHPRLADNISPPRNYTYTEVEEEYTEICPICKSQKTRPYFNAQQISAVNYQPDFSPWKLWMKCEECENLFVYNFPSAISTDHYYTIMKRNFWGQHFLKPRVSLAEFGSLIRKLMEYQSGRRYLEVGVGTGEFLAVAKEYGKEVVGIDVSSELCKQVSKVLEVPVICKDFLDYESEERFHVITLGDVIEHVKEPVVALEKAYDLLESKGVLWVSTPDYMGSYSQMMKFTDSMWNEPWHYTYFQKTSLCKILEKIGFQILEMQISRRYLGSIELFCRKTD